MDHSDKQASAAPLPHDPDRAWLVHDQKIHSLLKAERVARDRIFEIERLLDQARQGETAVEAGELLAERREIEARQRDRQVELELAEAARHSADLTRAAEKLESQLAAVEPVLREQGEYLRAALDSIAAGLSEFFAAESRYAAIKREVYQFMRKHGRGPTITPLEELTGLHPRVVATLKILMTDYTSRVRRESLS